MRNLEEKSIAKFYETITYANNKLRTHLLLAVNLLINELKKGLYSRETAKTNSHHRLEKKKKQKPIVFGLVDYPIVVGINICWVGTKVYLSTFFRVSHLPCYHLIVDSMNRLFPSHQAYHHHLYLNHVDSYHVSVLLFYPFLKFDY